MVQGLVADQGLGPLVGVAVSLGPSELGGASAECPAEQAGCEYHDWERDGEQGESEERGDREPDEHPVVERPLRDPVNRLDHYCNHRGSDAREQSRHHVGLTEAYVDG